MGELKLADANAMKMPRLIYWLSLLLLIIGGRVLIDPSNRQTGESIQVYITLIAFELYMWLLLVLARWQCSKGYGTDMARSGLFAVGLQGLQFVALDELLMISPNAGVALAVVATVLAGLKLFLAGCWLGFRLPKVLLGFIAGWLVLMPASGVIFHFVQEDSPWQQTWGFVLCWIVALLVAGHSLLAAWRKDEIRASVQAGQRWWIGWLISGSLAVMTFIQLCSIRRAFFVDFPVSFFMPIIAATAVSIFALIIARGWPQVLGWLVMAFVFLLMLGHVAIFEISECDVDWLKAAGGTFIHPLYPGALLASLLSIVVGVKLKSKPLLFFGLAVLVAGGLFRLHILFKAALITNANKMMKSIGEIIRRIFAWRYAQGVFLLGGAFFTLGLGAFLQHRATVHAKHTPPPLPPSSDENVPPVE